MKEMSKKERHDVYERKTIKVRGEKVKHKWKGRKGGKKEMIEIKENEKKRKNLKLVSKIPTMYPL